MLQKLNIIIVDDDRASTHYLSMKLKKLKLVETVDNAESAQELFEKYLPVKEYDIIYLDQLMPAMDGADAVKIIREKYPLTKIIFHTATNKLNEADKILNSKPDGWLWKDFKCSDAELSVDLVMQGRHFYSREAEDILYELLAARNDENKGEASRRITPRKKEIMLYYCRGLSHKEIASVLSIDVRTVETHINEIHRDYNIKTRAEIMCFAMEQNIIPKF